MENSFGSVPGWEGQTDSCLQWDVKRGNGMQSEGMGCKAKEWDVKQSTSHLRCHPKCFLRAPRTGASQKHKRQTTCAEDEFPSLQSQIWFVHLKKKKKVKIFKKGKRGEERPNPTKKSSPLRKERPAGLTKARPLLINKWETVVLVTSSLVLIELS